MLKYIKFVYEPMILLWNILFNFGFIFTIVRNFVLFFMWDPRTSIKSYKEIGKSLAELYYFIFLSEYFVTPY